MEIKKIPFLEEIFFSYTDDFQNLKNSIETIGLQQPVTLIKKGDDLFLLDGYKRFNILKQIDLFMIIEGYCSNEDILFEYCKKNSFRGFNSIEMSNILKVIKKYFNNDKKLIKKIFKINNMKYSEKLIEKFSKLESLIFKGKVKFLNETLNKNIALKISEIDELSQKIILNLFENLRLNNNKQKKTFEMLFDLSKREDLTIGKLIEKYFKSFLTEPYSKNLENIFFETLTRKHSPNFHSFNKKFIKFKNQLLAGQNSKINLYSPSFFEDENLKLEIFFKNLNELSIKLKLLDNNVKNLLTEKDFNDFSN
jgi:hypothetical protein